MAEDVALRFSNVGLFVVDMARMVDFYSRVLGFAITTRQARRTLNPMTMAALSKNSITPKLLRECVAANNRIAGAPSS